MCMVFCLHVRLCTTHVCDASGGQKKVSERIELELWVVVSCHVGEGKRAQVPVFLTSEPSPVPQDAHFKFFFNLYTKYLFAKGCE